MTVWWSIWKQKVQVASDPQSPASLCQLLSEPVGLIGGDKAAKSYMKYLLFYILAQLVSSKGPFLVMEWVSEKKALTFDI